VSPIKVIFDILLNVFEPPPSPAPVPPAPTMQLDIAIQTAYLTRLWWQKTATIEVLVVNKGTVATDVAFEYALIQNNNQNNQTVAKGSQTLFISGLDKKTVYITIPVPADGTYTIQIQTTQPVQVETHATITVETPIYGEPEFTITIIFLIALAIYTIKKRKRH